MVNLLSCEVPLSAEEEAERCQRLAQLPNAHMHWYGKSGHRPGRKLGHITVLLEAGGAEAMEQQRQRWLTQVREIWPRPEAPKAV